MKKLATNQMESFVGAEIICRLRPQNVFTRPICIDEPQEPAWDSAGLCAILGHLVLPAGIPFLNPLISFCGL